MKDFYKQIYQDFSDDTKTTFYLNTGAILLIFLFLLGPMKSDGFTNMLARLLIVSLLSYSLHTNIMSSKALLNIDNIFVSPSLALVRNNFLLNVVFSFIMFLFIIYLLSGFTNY